MNITSTISPARRARKALLGILPAALACAASLIPTAVHAQAPQHIGAVWYILLENRNFSED
jgi:hypothetical protein